MPGVRYGPDITDDAADALDKLTQLRKRLKNIKDPKARRAVQNRIDAINQYVNDTFGGRQGAQKMARYSLKRQGYASDEYLKSVKASKYRKRKGPGQLGLAETPEGTQGIGRKRGYRGREAVDEADRDLYKSATRAGKKAGRGSQGRKLEQVRKERKRKTDAASKARARKKAGAAKKAAAKKAAAKKNAPASTSRAPQTTKPRAAKKATAAKKAAPRRSR
jgi:hypothetical protein